MKKLRFEHLFFAVLLFGLIGFVITSCTNMVNQNGQEFEVSIQLDPNHVIEVEGCEYFVVDSYGALTYVHKGNCKNPIHCYNHVEK